MWIRIVAMSAISKILITGKVAIKCAALLNGSGSLLSSIRLIIRWTGRKRRRNDPASAMTSFLEIDEKSILFIGYEVITVGLEGYCYNKYRNKLC